MEYILMSIFGGGICDWQDISKTDYSWDEIIERQKILMEQIISRFYQ